MSLPLHVLSTRRNCAAPPCSADVIRAIIRARRKTPAVTVDSACATHHAHCSSSMRHLAVVSSQNDVALIMLHLLSESLHYSLRSVSLAVSSFMRCATPIPCPERIVCDPNFGVAGSLRLCSERHSRRPVNMQRN